MPSPVRQPLHGRSGNRPTTAHESRQLRSQIHGVDTEAPRCQESPEPLRVFLCIGMFPANNDRNPAIAQACAALTDRALPSASRSIGLEACDDTASLHMAVDT